MMYLLGYVIEHFYMPKGRKYAEIKEIYKINELVFLIPTDTEHCLQSGFAFKSLMHVEIFHSTSV
jgi:hypothetical protein